MFSDLVSQPFIKLEVFTARRKSSEVNHKGKGGSIQQHGEGLQGHRTQRASVVALTPPRPVMARVRINPKHF